MIEIQEKSKCCGCSACVSVCPQNCITMQADEEGFLYPTVQQDLCIGCDACEAVCPCLHRPQAQPEPAALAIRAKDQALRLFSSSGGIFSLLATDIFAKGGAVCGAVFAPDFSVQHTIAWTQAELEAMRGAKYVQSDLNDVFRQIRELVDQKIPVLFSGTPCQTAGLRAYLGSDQNQVLTVAIVCHGVPSPAVWQKYRKELGQVSDVRFRDKRNSWKRYATNYLVNGQELFRPVMDDPYMKGFLRDLYNRPSCTDCPAKAGGYADLTLGDFWGIEKIVPALDDDKGTSVLLIHTEAGKQAVSALADRVESKAVSFADAIRYNPAIHHAAPAHPERTQAMHRLQTESLAIVVDDYTRPSTTEKLKSLARRLLGRQ